MRDDIRFMWDTQVPMRDGVKLSTDIYLPAAGEAYPVILSRTPYDNIAPRLVEAAQFFSSRGYAVVLQDARGRFDSEGHFEPRVNEGKDGYDTIEWIAQQPWSTGKIGMMGGSYGGTVQWLAARERPPHLTTIVSSVTGGMRWMHDENYMNGKFPVFQFRGSTPAHAWALSAMSASTANRASRSLPLGRWECASTFRTPQSPSSSKPPATTRL